MSVLILDDDPDVGLAARLALRRQAPDVTCLSRPSELLARLETHRVDVLLLDLNFQPGHADGAQGLALLSDVLQVAEPPAVIVMTAYADVDLAVRAMRLGASDFITKPWNPAQLADKVLTCLQRRQARSSHEAGDSVFGESPLLGRSPAMLRLREQILQVAATDASVFVRGEMGTGKELVAQELHRLSRRVGGPFMPVDMGALPESTFDSEMFGHRRGAFTDARHDRAGRVQAARGGTLFLDEITNLPWSHQAKLLAMLERRQVTPVGADWPEAVDVRVVAASNWPQEWLLDPGRFRQDLYYRLNTVELVVPPLRERTQDILPLAQHFLSRYCALHRQPPKPLSEPASLALEGHAWPGNVRDLRQACERAVIFSSSPRWLVTDFGLAQPGASHLQPASAALVRPLADQERDALERALQESRGNVSEASRRLGLSRGAFYRRRDKHGL